jgi:hypothetical protein
VQDVAHSVGTQARFGDDQFPARFDLSGKLLASDPMHDKLHHQAWPFRQLWFRQRLRAGRVKTCAGEPVFLCSIA